MFSMPNAILVITDTVPNPMRAGKFFTSMSKLTWLNEANEVITNYGCNTCGVITSAQPQMSIHVGLHNGKDGKRKPKLVRKMTKSERRAVAVGEVQRTIDDLIAERDKYKSLARLYARRLKAISESIDTSLL